MRQMQWTVSVKRDGDAQGVALTTFTWPVDGATVADFGLSLEEGRHLLRTLQEAVTQSQICAYDCARRCCRHCICRIATSASHASDATLQLRGDSPNL